MPIQPASPSARLTATESPSESIPCRRHSGSASSNGRTEAQKAAASSRSERCSSVRRRSTAGDPTRERIGFVQHERAWITTSDGTRLAARLWLPEATPAATLLEALPYRMDDLTASYSSEYE